MGLELSQNMINSSGNRKQYIIQGDITNSKTYNGIRNEKFDRIVSHYVFTEINKNGLEKAFRNAKDMLNSSGIFIFTITDPRTRYLMEFDGYKLDFGQEKYSYDKEDTPFSVLLKEGDKYVDVGIRDFHNPVEVYDSLLETAGFRNIKRINIKRPQDKDNFAILYDLKNQ
ncbi:MAG: methyltransferase domain-containing protein [Candidatus Pacearchaeota archaeon]|nr:methyltransferase domain-containing protein [Candidatus Pacearchaeota archaeon]